MKLFDVRQTPYGKVADVQLETAILSFSMPYAEYCELEAAGRLNDETVIESNVRFMTLIHETRIPYPLDLGTNFTIEGREVAEFGSPQWYNGIAPIEF